VCARVGTPRAARSAGRWPCRHKRRGAQGAPGTAGAERPAAGQLWNETGLVFATSTGTALDAANVRRVGHAGTVVTEAVYREELRPVLVDGAAMIGCIFATARRAESGWAPRLAP
jgi:hypothetical protein